MGILELLTVVFVTLKLLDLITWSWVAVTSPLWAGYGITIILCAIVALCKINRN